MSRSPRSSSARVYPSLVRTIHIAGIERKAAGLLMMVNLQLLFAFRLNWISPTLALLTVVLLLPALRRATKRDPQILGAYRAHVLHSGIYLGQPPHTHPHPRTATTL